VAKLSQQLAAKPATTNAAEEGPQGGPGPNRDRRLRERVAYSTMVLERRRGFPDV
jgi:hypothetical protein